MSDIDQPAQPSEQVAPSPAAQSDVQQPPTSPIPWENRKSLGVMKAFFKTIAYVLSRNGRIGGTPLPGLDLKQAMKFRSRTTRYLILMFILLAVVKLISSYDNFASVLDQFDITLKTVYVLLIGLSLGLFLLWAILRMATGIVGWFFVQKQLKDEVEDRSIAAAYYTSAALSLLLVMLPLSLLCFIPIFGHSPVARVVPAAIYILVWVYWYQLILNAVWSAVRSGKRVVVTAICLPILWIIVYAWIAAIPGMAAMWFMVYGTVL